MNLILFDDAQRDHLLPFVFTRPCADIRIGICTLREKWEQLLAVSSSTLTLPYLSEKYPVLTGDDNLYINGRLLPDEELLKSIHSLKLNEQLMQENRVLAAKSVKAELKLNADWNLERVKYNGKAALINNTWDIFKWNDAAIRSDFERMTHGRKSITADETNRLLSPGNIFIEEGAKVSCSVINASAGPVYIDAGAEVMEGCLIRGPFALGEHAVLKMGAKVYGATTIGAGSKVGGEINNSVIFGNSNKAHDGFLGNSVIGEWCNLGADTNNSNLKNNYSEVKVWDYVANDYVKTGLQFCGLMMGDHSKCGINTMFNTGTVAGICANIFGAGFPPKFIPSFYWGDASDGETFKIDKAIELARIVYQRRGKMADEKEENILRHLFKQLQGK